MPSVIQRFQDKIERTDTCWNWIACKECRKYHQIQYKKRHSL